MEKKELLKEISIILENGLPDKEEALEYSSKLLDEYVDKVSTEERLRLMAEFENYKKRISKNNKSYKEKVVYDIIKPLTEDLLEDWSQFSSHISRFDNIEISQSFHLMNKKFNQYLETFNIEEISVKVGDIFNPDLHESITTMDENKVRNTILKVFSKGYQIDGTIYKYPKVIVQS